MMGKDGVRNGCDYFLERALVANGDPVISADLFAAISDEGYRGDSVDGIMARLRTSRLICLIWQSRGVYSCCG
jgi:hypothetical protein